MVILYHLPTQDVLDLQIQKMEELPLNVHALMLSGSRECGPVFEELSHFLPHLFHVLQLGYDDPFKQTVMCYVSIRLD